MSAVYQRPSDGAWVAVPQPQPLRVVIRAAVLNALAYTNGDQLEAATLLGISARNLITQMDAYGIPTNRVGLDRGAARQPRHVTGGGTHLHGRPPRPTKES